MIAGSGATFAPPDQSEWFNRCRLVSTLDRAQNDFLPRNANACYDLTVDFLALEEGTASAQTSLSPAATNPREGWKNYWQRHILLVIPVGSAKYEPFRVVDDEDAHGKHGYSRRSCQ